MTAQRSGPGTAVAGGSDTIVALATPPGRSAIAVVRLSGPDAHAVASRVVTPWPVPERTARLCMVHDPETREPIDRSLVTCYAGGRSYTGEPMVEIATHGGHLVPGMAMAALIAAGAREATPGEFTRRAVLNGKLDLLRAEAIGDLIDARSKLMHQTALSQLDGGLSQRVEALRSALIGIEALIAYDIDFPEEDDGPIDRAAVLDAADDVLRQLDVLLATAPAGELVREGAITVLAGVPNAGKSSLYNALLGQARALVTDSPGTTRDALEAVVDMAGWPIRLVDTAGLRDSADAVERLGIEMSERFIGRAHLVLVCGETESSLQTAVARVRTTTSAPMIAVRTKGDLVTRPHQYPGRHLVAHGDEIPPNGDSDRDRKLVTPQYEINATGRSASDLVSYGNPSTFKRIDTPLLTLVPLSDYLSSHVPADLVTDSDKSAPERIPVLTVSASTGAGLRELRQAVVAVLRSTHGAPSAEIPMLTRARHARGLATARIELRAFRDAWADAQLPAPIAAVYLRDAVIALESLIGAVDVEDVLDRVFSAFCVGK